MAEIEILFPTVQYGNVKLRATPEELGLDGPADAYALGVQSAVLLNLFTQGFKVGSQLDVEHDDGGPKPPPPAPIERVEVDPEELIKTTLGATTISEEAPYAEPEEDLYRELPNNGEGPETSDDAPWSQSVDAKPKPWETGKAAPTNAVKVAEINW